MAVAVDATGTKLVQGSSAVTTLSYTGLTVGTGLTNGALIGLLILGNSSTTASSSFTAVWDNGGTNQSMTQIGTISQTTGGLVQLVAFGLLNPTSGNKTLKFSWTTSNYATACAISLTGVDQSSASTSFINFISTSGALGANANQSVTVTSAVNDMVIGCFGTNSGIAATAMNGTIIFSDSTSANGADSAGNRQAGAATVTVTSHESAVAGDGCTCGFDVVQATASTLITVPRKNIIYRRAA